MFGLFLNIFIQELLVPLLKSLLCLKGNDNGRRFLVISLACYFSLILLSSALSQAAILMILLFVVTTPVLAASSFRRIHDAGFATPLAAIPVVIYWVNLFGIAYIQHGSRWGLLVLATLATLAMATVSNARVRRNHHYQMGYYGPINLNVSKEAVVQPNRIEPTIAGRNPDQNAAQKTIDAAAAISTDSTASEYSPIDDIMPSTDANERNPVDPGWEQQLVIWFNQNRQLSIMVATILSVAILTLIALSASEDQTIPEVNDNSQQAIQPKQKVRLNKIEMPDQFWIMLDENDSLTIGWEGDIQTKSDLGENNSYWSAYTGKGDKTCVDLHFSLGADIKTLLVTVKNGGDYYADFSPTDTQTIVKSIADKDRFKLCGYEFVLKGTRNLLRKNKKYKQYLGLN